MRKVTKRAASTASLCDASANHVLDTSRQDFLRYVSGYYLEPVGRSWPSEAVVACLVGLAVVGGLAMAWRRGVGKRGNKIAAEVCLLAIVVACCGCRGRSSPSPALATSPIRISNPVVNLGTLQRGGKNPESVTVEIINLMDQPLRLKVSPATCGCIRATFRPSNEVPGLGKVELVLSADVSARPAGPLGEMMVVSIEGREEYQRMTVTGLVEGVGRVRDYVVRPVDFQKGRTPPLTLEVVTGRSSTPITVDSVTCDAPGIAADVKGVRVLPAMPVPEGFSRKIEIPMQVSRPPKSTTAKIQVAYRLGGKEGREELTGMLLVD